MLGPIEATNLKVDAKKLLSVLTEFVYTPMKQGTKVLIVHPPGVVLMYVLPQEGVYDASRKAFLSVKYGEMELHECFKGTYVEEVRNLASAGIARYGNELYRSRILIIKPGVVYPMHTDDDGYRYHIPLVTSKGSLFVTNGTVGAMHEVGRLYRYHTNEPHTAFNLHPTELRAHIIFDIK